jgi:biopolymer transport protein ExbB
MNPAHDLGIAHFLANTDPLARGILVVLLTMSIVSWYLILSRALLHALDWSRGEAFARALPGLCTFRALAAHIQQHQSTDPLTQLATAGVAAGRRYDDLRSARPAHDPAPGELLVRDMDDAISTISTRLDRGLIVLASIGSSAPYIGLLGTVWGVYHALVSIGLSGQGTLDRVAGPVGEALIMTALGLAVAIPAVLGYNAFVRANRVTIARLESLANTLMRLIATGATPAPAPSRALEATAAPQGAA